MVTNLSKFITFSLSLFLLSSCSKGTNFKQIHFENKNKLRENVIFNNENEVNLKEYKSINDAKEDYFLLYKNERFVEHDNNFIIDEDLMKNDRLFMISILSTSAYYPLFIIDLTYSEKCTEISFNFYDDPNDGMLGVLGEHLAYHYFFIPLDRENLKYEINVYVTYETEKVLYDQTFPI